MKKAYPFPPPEDSPYLQAFIVAGSNGHIILARVKANNFAQGQAMARQLCESLWNDSAWDSAAYPCGNAEQEKGPGFDILKGA